MCPGIFLHTKKSKLEFDERSRKSPVLCVHFPGPVYQHSSMMQQNHQKGENS